MNPDTVNLLSNARRILYMSHMAIGDYLYQRTYLKMLAEQYPNAELDLWIDDFRIKNKDWQKGRSDFLTDWMKDETFISRLYPQATSVEHRQQMLTEAKARGYDAVLFIANLRSERFAKAAAEIAGKSGYSAGVINHKPMDWLQPWKYAKLSVYFKNNKRDSHLQVLQKYGGHFAKLAALPCASEMAPVVVPETVAAAAREQINSWHQQFTTRRVALINTISTTTKRDYPWDKMAAVIQRLHRQYPGFLFVLNTPPHLIKDFERSAEELRNRTQIPAVAFTSTAGVNALAAMISAADCVISVETAIMHFAEALKIPQCVLMRNASAHWCPQSARYRLFSDTIVADLSDEVVADKAMALLNDVSQQAS